ncbi:Protein of uncharacterised function (DUF2971) [Serratia entomophila]|uniref:DUF2971 domain-containing protein n=1 Tax=Serratia entomophila TaxID=42906 RepID=UPI002179C8C0|nr:DUF2971 domain-containing protein [Serratia entomophila]CAI1754758.1 Protein of uncharacterised function (DUF2971) [Serratia entomophila]CAI2925947.1 Protein of uncharacterised function (DUF2971) [Serratia entomophila]
MDIPFPFVYKFSALNINSLSALSEGKAWFSKLSDFNDPFEGQFIVSPPDLKNDREKFFEHMAKNIPSHPLTVPAAEAVRKRYFDSPDEFESFVNKLVIETHHKFYESYLNIVAYCLASDIAGVEASHVSNVMMWSHYADGMKGFCIKYNPNKLMVSLNKLNDEKFYWAKIEYQDDKHTVDYYDLVDTSKHATIRAIQTKHTGWEYEYECRLLVNNSGLYKYSHDAIECIYIGSKMPVPHQKILLDICSVNLPDVDIFNVRTHGKGYAVELGRYQKYNIS